MAERDKVKLDRGRRDRDLIELFEQTVRYMPRGDAAPEAEQTVAIPVSLATGLLELLQRRVPKPLARPHLSGQDELKEAEIIAEACARKAELIFDQCMPKGKATDVAAEEARLRFLEVGRPLSIQTIKRWMERSPR